MLEIRGSPEAVARCPATSRMACSIRSIAAAVVSTGVPFGNSTEALSAFPSISGNMTNLTTPVSTSPQEMSRTMTATLRLT